jgi:hypothetical protein
VNISKNIPCQGNSKHLEKREIRITTRAEKQQVEQAEKNERGAQEIGCLFTRREVLTL